jgi:ATP-dependent helicase/nuclease subunit A
MKPPMIGHEAISASAGSGKTYQLANRYVRLLAGKAPPDRICALTFSRKAAGEMFEAIVGRLCSAAASPEAAKKAAGEMGLKGMTTSDFLNLLGSLMDNLHRLRVGTLDSFIISIVRAFPAELGIPAGFQVVDNDSSESEELCQQALSILFDPRHIDTNARENFLNSFKQATFGREEKNPAAHVNRIVDQYRDFYRVLPDEPAWGNENIVWPDGNAWLKTTQDVDSLVKRMERALKDSAPPDKIMKRWRTFLNLAGSFDHRSLWDDHIEYMFERLINEISSLRSGSATLTVDRLEQSLSKEQCDLALGVIGHVIAIEIKSALEKTHGIYRVLHHYEQLHDSLIRRAGQLTFSDAQYLLTPSNPYSGGAVISRRQNEERRLYIDYRLDSQLDHWLLDEFQDTSDLQWAVLSNLIDETLQDTSGQRSFFYVGDVKQAIYGWRGGNARLFGKILRHYKGLIEEKPLNTSFRSCQVVIDTVNKVFGNLAETGLPERAIHDWSGIWRSHECQIDHVPRDGYVALLEPPHDERKPTAEDRHNAVAAILNEVNPISRGLTAGILVRTNDEGRDIANFLRKQCPGMNVVHEGKAAIKDNPVAALLISLIKLAGHPGDMFAWRHIQMSPLASFLAQSGLTRDNLPLRLLTEVSQHGFETLIRDWGEVLDAAHRLDAYGRDCLDAVLAAGIAFDATGSRDCDGFLRFVEDYEMPESATADAVRVMTIHQSKGLGFDVVILPELAGRSLGSAGRVDIAIARDTDTNAPQWALCMPRKLVAISDPVLAHEVEAADENSCFDALCVLYVAMTRAKRALYMITSYPGPTSTALTAAAFLKKQLTGESNPEGGTRITVADQQVIRLYEHGSKDWFQKLRGVASPHPVTQPPELEPDFAQKTSARTALSLLEPSAQEQHVRAASGLFDAERRAVLDFGNAIHELFSKVEWIEDCDVMPQLRKGAPTGLVPVEPEIVAQKIIAEWQPSSHIAKDVRQDVCGQFTKALLAAEIRGALAKPKGKVVLWREKRFEVVMDGATLVGGIFDRVVIVEDEHGKPKHAVILDYKSDRIDREEGLTRAVEGYRPQLLMYRDALSQILHIAPSAIDLRLVFTRPARVVDLQ